MLIAARRPLFLGAALLTSGATALVAQHWLQSQVRHAQVSARAQTASAPATQVLVAAQPLPAGTILAPKQLRWQAWPAGAAASYFTSGAITAEQLKGAVVRTDLAPGEPLNAARVVQPGDRSFLAAVLKPGFRAITINVAANTGVAGFVVPGDHVDLILSRAVEAGGAGRRFVSETLLSDVRVVGMDQRASNEKKDVVAPQTATLEVTPKQAEAVALASDLGRLTLSLRSLADPAPGSAAPANGDWTWSPGPSASPPVSPPHRERRAGRGVAPAAGVVVVRGVEVSASGAAK